MKQRSLKLNNALHLYFTQVSDSLNHAGVSFPVLIKDIEVDITPEHIKVMFKAIAKTKYGKDSTAQLTANEITACFEEMNRHLSNFDVSVSFPSQETTENYLNSFIQ